jgi:TctA family transporter
MLEAAMEGLAGVLQPQALTFMCLGVLIGSLVGFLPGIGGPSTLAIMLPFVMTMQDPMLVIALLVGMDAVGNTASAFTSILISVPGSSGSQATILDGHPMAKNGEAARALESGGVFSTATAEGDESSRSSMICASSPCPAPRSTTRPTRNSRRTRRATPQAS